jgi:hypothetical protein
MPQYRIRTVAGGAFSVGVGGSVTTFEIEDLVSRQRAFYTLAGIDFSLGFRAGSQGPSSWTTFVSNAGLKDFHGYVTLTSLAAVAGVGAGAFRMSFVTGPSKGLMIPGIGWSTGLGAGLTGTHGWMKSRD